MSTISSDTTGHFQSHYIPNTADEQAEMLSALGIDSIDQLFADIPDEYRNPTLDLPAPLSELEIQRELGGMAAKNRSLGSGPSFLGAGSYNHFIPSIIKPLITRRHPAQHSGEPRLVHGLHALPGRGQPGDPSGDLRVPDPGLQPLRHGGGQRWHV